MICTFFGHADTPMSLFPLIQQNILSLLAKTPDILFYVGNHGNFDRMVLSILKKAAFDYPKMQYCVVLAYFPYLQDNTEKNDTTPTLFPEILETVPKRFAISYRNKWMVEHSDLVIAYVTHNTGGAAKYFNMAKKKGLTVINLAEISSINITNPPIP